MVSVSSGIAFSPLFAAALVFITVTSDAILLAGLADDMAVRNVSTRRGQGCDGCLAVRKLLGGYDDRHRDCRADHGQKGSGQGRYTESTYNGMYKSLDTFMRALHFPESHGLPLMLKQLIRWDLLRLVAVEGHLCSLGVDRVKYL